MQRQFMLSRLLMLSTFAFFALTVAQAQDEENFRRQTFLHKKIVLPTSPEAANLGRYGDFQVGHYTGALNFSLPVYTIQGRDLSFPVALTYDGSGNRVTNVPTWVGLGWTLQCGGVITRSTQADPDMEINYYSKAAEVMGNPSADKFVENTLLYDVAKAKIETQPDQYFFNFGGRSGKFYISPNKGIYLKEAPDFAISATFETDGDITRFDITDEYGNVYEFTAVEETFFDRDDGYGDVPMSNPTFTYNSSWFLTRIITANAKEEVLLTYTGIGSYTPPVTQGLYASLTRSVESYYEGDPGCPDTDPCPPLSLTNGGAVGTNYIIDRKMLQSVTYKLGGIAVEKLEFLTTANTCTGAYGGKKLDKIVLKRGESATTSIMEYVFGYDCSTNRLTLKTFKEQSSPGVEKAPYTFQYNSTTLPAPDARAIDHWGYYNGLSSSLIPTVYYGTFPCQSVAGDGGYRDTDSDLVKAGSLNRVTFPTGGYSDLVLEANKVEKGACTPDQEDRFIGGLRVKEINNYDNNTPVPNLISTRSYQYIKEGAAPGGNLSSSGKLLVEPEYLSTSSYHQYPCNTLPGGWCVPQGIEYQCDRATITAADQSTLGATLNTHFGYDRVEELYNGGKTVYWFRNSPPSSGTSDDISNGDLLKKQEYDSNSKLLVETLNYYTAADSTDTRRNNSFTAFKVLPMANQDNREKLCLQSNGVYVWDVQCNTGTNPTCVQSKIYKSKFRRESLYLKQQWKYLYKTHETRYFYNASGTLTGSVPNLILYKYGNVNVTRPTEVIRYNSDGVEHKLVTRYAHDVNQTNLISRRMIAMPLEEENYVGGASVYRTKLEYTNFGSPVWPYKYSERFNPAGSDIVRDNIDAYDGYGNITQAHREHDQPFSLIWSHNGSVLAAKVQNATPTQVAFTSFDTRSTYQGGWTVSSPATNIQYGLARTGSGFFQPTSAAAINKNGNSAGRYVLSYYTTSTVGAETVVVGTGSSIVSTTNHPADAAGWTFVEVVILIGPSNNNITLNVQPSTKLDDLRLYPEGALMTTFSHLEPNRLLAAISDESGTPSEFDYDGMMRLRGVRDVYKNYLQSYEYRYLSLNGDNSVRSRTVLKDAVTNFADIANLTGGDVHRTFKYFDGIGRPVQTNDLAQSPAQNDIITPQAYDTYGRETIQYLPYTIAANDGALRTAALTEQSAFYSSLDGGFGYTEQVLENSPLSRPKEVKPPGSLYRQHPSTTTYTTNAANEVRNFRQTGTTAWFAANRLYKITTADENGVLTHSYKDRLGRTIMVNRAGAKTYYVFDNTSNLWAVIPPEATLTVESLGGWTPSNSLYQERIYKYNYDLNTQNLNSKRVPGTTTTTNYWYDRLDRVVMTRDPAQTKIVTKYDVLGRPVIIGKYTGTATPLSTNGLYETRNTVAPHYYTTTTSFPTDAANIQVYTVNYYDHYDIDGNGSLSAAENFNTPPSGYPAPTLRMRGKLTVAKNAVLPADGSAPTQYLHQRTWLDLKGRTVQSKAENHLAGQDVVFSAYKFPGWLEKTRREHTATPPGGTLKTININQQMTYDHAGRLLKTEQKIDGEAAFTTLSEQSWSERNLLTQKKLHKTSGGTFLQTLDYTYNIRGWLERINDFTTTADLFHLQLTYKTGDPAVNSGYTGGAGANWNGNITTMEWQANNGARRLYACFYDGRDELLSANYVERNGAAFNQNNNYTDGYTYDLNGNIKTCTRRGWLGSAYGITDQLTYTYDGTHRDRLVKVADVGSATRGFLHTPPASGNHYIYDSNGNLTTDHHKKATFAYNHLNLPRSVAFTTTSPNPKIEWLYDAAGMKLTKKLYSGTTLTGSKNYINGIEYSGANLEAIYHADGRLLPNGTAWHYDYTLKDHLGNARVTFRASGSTWTNVEEMHYYPFGMQMENAGTANPTNKYLYNGKERNEDFGLNLSDYGARWYDPAVGRWWSVDKLTDVSPEWSPFRYAFNNPMNYIDPDGNYEIGSVALSKEERQEIKDNYSTSKERREARRELKEEKRNELRQGIAFLNQFLNDNPDVSKVFQDFSGIKEGTKGWDNLWKENGKGVQIKIDGNIEAGGITSKTEGTMEAITVNGNYNSIGLAGIMAHEYVHMGDNMRPSGSRYEGTKTGIPGYGAKIQMSALVDAKNTSPNPEWFSKSYARHFDKYGNPLTIELGYAFEKIAIGGVYNSGSLKRIAVEYYKKKFNKK